MAMKSKWISDLQHPIKTRYLFRNLRIELLPVIILLAAICFASCSKEKLDVVRNRIPAPFKYLAGLFDGDGIGAAVAISPNVQILFNQSGDRYAWIENDSLMDERDIADPEGLFSLLTLDDVGAGALAGFRKFYLFNRAGSRFIEVIFHSTDTEGQWANPRFFTFQHSPYPVDKWGLERACPFTEIGAVWDYYAISDCSEFPKNAIRMVNRAGSEYVDYDLETERFGDNPFYISNYPLNSCEIDPINKVSSIRKKDSAYLPLEVVDAASIYYNKDNKAAGELFFTDGGKKFGFREFDSTEFQGPFSIY